MKTAGCLSLFASVAVALLVSTAPLPAFGGMTLQEFSNGFEDGALPAGWQAQAGMWSAFGLAYNPPLSHGGSNFSFQQSILPVVAGNTGSLLSFRLPEGGDIYEMEGWFYVEHAAQWGMTTSVFYFNIPGNLAVGTQASPDVSGQSGYYGLYTGSGTYGGSMNLPQQTWHSIKVRYDRRAGTQDVLIDNAYYAQGYPVDTANAAPTDLYIYVAGGYSPGCSITQYVDDIVVRVWTEDLVPPTVTLTTPAAGATNVPAATPILVTFSEPVAAGAALGDIRLKSSKTVVPVTTSVDGSVLAILPGQPLAAGTSYTVSIPAGAVADSSGNALAAPYAFKFTTAR